MALEFGSTLWRNTYISFHLCPESYQGFFSLVDELNICIVESTFLCDCSKFLLKAVQVSGNALLLCVRGKDGLASFYCSDWGGLVAASTPGKLISCTREPSHVVYKSSTEPWSLGFFDAGEDPKFTFTFFGSDSILINSSDSHLVHYVRILSCMLYFKELSSKMLESKNIHLPSHLMGCRILNFLAVWTEEDIALATGRILTKRR